MSGRKDNPTLLKVKLAEIHAELRRAIKILRGEEMRL